MPMRARPVRSMFCNALACMTTVLEVAATSRPRELRHEMMTARSAARELLAHAASHSVAIVFGNETSGLSSAEASLCQIWAGIPANPDYASLNLAAAVQVFTYELRMALPDGAQPHVPEFEPATHEQVEQLYQHFGRTMAHSGYLDPANPKRWLPRLQRLFARARLESEEVNFLRGFLKAVDKMRR
jgi:tRNA/rRNA methyltransferase